MTAKNSGKGDGVGYRNPPRTTRFPKGKSGNPNGRPSGSKNLKSLIMDELDRTVTLQENGRAVKLSKRQALAKRVVNQGLGGDPRAITTLISMDQTLEDALGEVKELSPDDRVVFERAIERMAQSRMATIQSTNQG